MKFLPTLLITGISLTACHKKDAAPTIDFGPNGGITARDANGNLQSPADPTDWRMQGIWNKQEQDLFKSLSLNLNGNQEGGVKGIELYPNPATNATQLYIEHPGNATQFAHILVNQEYQVVRTLVINVAANGYTFDLGRLKKEETYRLYYVFYSGNTLIEKGHGDIRMANKP
ncbi:hypothetical protein [Hymenobacter lapidiphilus]|uniref:Uncharacterized protein n=1 Tax=Hymenobacter lapidiphilus TaxID=2608003 RepID=A0A7Y7PP19_9BACT|nr:hypothetical protein [Hymenobacter lapidiphilus]NVO31389.1 hypothetical protein [Hymenobacter lapidiphilus]